MPDDKSLKREEIVKSKLLFQKAFSRDNSVLSLREGCLQVKCFSHHQIPSGLKAAFLVPKRQVKKAVDRNKAKRLIREAYRLNKESLKDLSGETEIVVYTFWLYRANQVSSFHDVNDSVKKLISRILEKIPHPKTPSS